MSTFGLLTPQTDPDPRTAGPGYAQSIVSDLRWLDEALFVWAKAHADIKWDGVTDDTTALHNLMVDLPEGVVIGLPSGHGKLSGIAFPKDDQLIVAPGPRLSVVDLVGSGAGISNANPTANRLGCGVAGLGINGAAAGAGARGIELENFQDCDWERIDITMPIAGQRGVKVIGGAYPGHQSFYNRLRRVNISAPVAASGDGGWHYEIGDLCNGTEILGGIWGGAGDGLRCNPDTLETDSCILDRVKIQNSGATMLELGVGAASVFGWEINARIEPSGVVGWVRSGPNGRDNQHTGVWTNTVKLDDPYPPGITGNRYLIPSLGNSLDRRDYRGEHNLWVPSSDGGGYVPLSESNARGNGSENTGQIIQSGRPHCVARYFHKGQVFHGAVFGTAGAPAVGPTHSWQFLMDLTTAVLAVSPDATTTAIAANSPVRHIMTTPYVFQESGWYYVGIDVTVASGLITDMPSWIGRTYNNTVFTSMAPVLTGSLSTGHTTPPAVGDLLGTGTPKVVTPQSAAPGFVVI